MTMPDFRRDRWQHPLVQDAAYNRSSSAAKTIEDTWNLEMWARRNVVYGMAHDASLVARALALPGHPQTWDEGAKSEANRIHEQAAAVALAHKGADIGTALHTMTQMLDEGTEFDAGIYAADLAAYAGAMAMFDVVHIEVRMVCRELRMAGTADRILRRDGRCFIADIKTGATVEYGGLGWGAQLASYAHGEIWDTENDKPLDTPPLDRAVGIIIHLPAGQGRCDLYEVDLVAGYRAAELANTVRDVRREAKRWISPFSPPVALPVDTDPPVGTPAAAGGDLRAMVVERARVLKDNGHVKLLAQRWPAGVPGLIGDHVHTAEELEQVLEVVRDVEMTAGMPFHPADAPPKPVRTLRVVPTAPSGPRGVDEGGAAADSDVEDVKTFWTELGAEERSRISRVAGQANEAGMPISIAQSPTRRRVAIARALIQWLEYWDEDIMRSLAAGILDAEMARHPATPFGAVIGAMTAEEAQRFEAVAVALRDGALLANVDDRWVIQA